MFIYQHNALSLQIYLFQVVCNQSYHEISPEKKISTILNKSENLYFSDNDNKHITGEQAYLFPTVLNKKSTAVWEAIWNQPDGDKRVL